MKIAKKILAFILCIATVASTIPMQGFAKETEKILYQNDFETGDAGDVTGNGFSVTERNGNHVLEIQAAQEEIHLASVNTNLSDMANYAVSADFSFEIPAEDVDWYNGGIVFRYQNEKNFYQMRLDVSPGVRKSIQFYKWVNGTGTKLAETSLDWNTNQVYQLKIAADGPYLTGYVDGEAVISCVDSSIPTGTIGFRVGNGQAYFDNVIIEELPEPAVTIDTPQTTQNTNPVELSGTVLYGAKVAYTLDNGERQELSLDSNSRYRRNLGILPRGSHTITVYASHFDGSDEKSSQVSFTIAEGEDFLKPSLTRSENIDVLATIPVSFNSVIEEETLTADSVKLFSDEAFSDEVSVKLSYNGEKGILVEPEEALKAGKTYYLNIYDSLKDVAGVGVSEEYVTLTFETAPDVSALPPVSEEGRVDISLNGDWKFTTDSGEAGNNNRWFAADYDISKWDTLSVPGNWDTENEYASYSGTAWYAKDFQIPESYRGYPVKLYFEAVYWEADVYVNGEYLGSHEGGYTPFEFDVASLLNYGEDAVNRVTVRVNNVHSGGHGAWWKWGGFSGGAELVVHNGLRMEWNKITPTPNLEDKTGTITAEYSLSNRGSEARSVEIETVFKDWKTNEILTTVTKTAEVPAGAKDFRVTAEKELATESYKLWGVDEPNLYTANTMIRTEGEIMDTGYSRIGFRKVEIDSTGTYVLLNGEKVRLLGFNRLWDDRVNGNTEPGYVFKRDIDYIKSMGGNCARMEHVPMDPDVIDYCDEVGMLLIEEIGVWGGGDPRVFGENPLTKQWLKEMIERDYNHPSIFAWSVANEIAARSDHGKQYVKTMFDYIRSDLDTSRLLTYVSNTAAGASSPTDDAAQYCDFVCINSYGGWGSATDSIRKLWPDKPIFATEYGSGQNKENPNDNTVNVKSMLDQYRSRPFVFGASLWTLNDYRDAYKDSAPSSGNRIWGVTTVWGDLKRSFEATRKDYAPIRGITTVHSTGEAKPGEIVLSSVIIEPRNELDKDMPAYTLKDYSLVWEVLDKEGNATAGGTVALPDITAGGERYTNTISWTVPESGALSFRASLVSPLNYDIYDTEDFFSEPTAIPEILGVETADGKARVTFTRPVGTKEYCVIYKGADGAEKVSANTINDFVEITGLTNGETYTFAVAAVNGKGRGEASSETEAVINQNNQMLSPQIFHTEPVANGFYTGFEAADKSILCDLRYRKDGETKYTEITGITVKGAYKVDQLEAGNKYFYQMRQTGSDWGTEIPAIPEKAVQEPQVPVVKGVMAGETNAAVSFYPADKATGYVVRYGTSKENLDHEMVVNHAYIQQILIDGLTADTEYWFSVSALHEEGQSAFSAPVSFASRSLGETGEMIVSFEEKEITYNETVLEGGKVQVSIFNPEAAEKEITIRVGTESSEELKTEEVTFMAAGGTVSQGMLPVICKPGTKAGTYQVCVEVLEKDKVIGTKMYQVNVKETEELFFEDFEDGWNKNQWSGKTDTVFTIIADESAEGNHQLSGAVTSGTGSEILIAEEEFSDFIATASIALTSPAAGNVGYSAGLVFRYQDDKNFYHIRIDVDRSNEATLQLYKWVDGQATQLKSISLENIDVTKPHQLTIDAEGTELTGYLDGTEQFRLSDSSFEAGKIGYRSYACTLITDNLNVYREKDAPEEEETVSKKTLEYFLNSAKQHVANGDTDDCVQSIKDLFAEAIAEGEKVMADEKATKEDVLNAAAKLMKAIQALEMKVGDKTDLEMAAELAEMIELTKYVEVGQEEFTAALEVARGVLTDGDAMQEEIDSAWDELVDTMNNLRLKANKEALEALLKEVESIDFSLYTEESVQGFQTVLVSAQTVLADAMLTIGEQQVVDDAVKALKQAKADLVLKEDADKNDGEGQEKPSAGSDSSEKPGDGKDNGKDDKDTDTAVVTGDSTEGLPWILMLMLAAGYVSIVSYKRKQARDINK